MTNGSGVLTNLQVYNNYFHGTTGQTTTAQIFIESPGGPPSGTLNNITGAVFNNLLVQTEAGSGWNNGFIGVSNVSSTSHITLAVYNNTFYSSDVAGQAIGVLFTAARTAITLKNNIFRNARVGYGAGGSFTTDYNMYYMASFNWDGAEGGPDPFIPWKVDCSCDAHSQSGNDPLLDVTTFIPQAGSPVIGFGTNLTGLGIAALNVDKAGNPRPSIGAWDVGAYQYVKVGIADHGIWNVDYPTTSRQITPNPFTISTLIHLAKQDGLKIYDILGNSVTLSGIRENGVYFVGMELQTARKIVIIK
jgi:hypothetical protein